MHCRYSISCSLLIIAAGLALLFPILELYAAAAEQQSPIMSVSIQDLSAIAGADASPMDLDVSSDGDRIAVEFFTRHANGEISAWVGVWTIPIKHLVRACKVYALSASESRNLELSSGLRFSPDGQRIIVLTGPQIHIISVDDCAQLAVLYPARLKTKSANGPTIRGFDVSSDAGRIAVLSDDAQYSLPGIRAIYESRSSIEVFTVSGQHVSEFSLNGAFHRFAISPDGSRVLVSGVFTADLSPNQEDVILFDASSGEALRRIRTGFRWLRTAGNGIPIAFLSGSEIIAAPSSDSDSSGKYGGGALKIFDLRTGKLVREMTVRHFGPLGTLAVGSRSRVVTTINFWQSRTEIFSDFRIHHARAELLVFRITDGKAFRISSPVRTGSGLAGFHLRLSADGSVVALFDGDSAEVYRLSEAISGTSPPMSKADRP